MCTEFRFPFFSSSAHFSVSKPIFEYTLDFLFHIKKKTKEKHQWLKISSQWIQIAATKKSVSSSLSYPIHSLWELLVVFHLSLYLAQLNFSQSGDRQFPLGVAVMWGGEWIRAKSEGSHQGRGWCQRGARLFKWSHQSLIIPFTQVRSGKLASPLRCMRMHVCIAL